MKIVGNVSKLSESLPNMHNLHNLHNLCKKFTLFLKMTSHFYVKKANTVILSKKYEYAVICN